MSNERERVLFKLGQHGVPYEQAKTIRRLAVSYNTIQERWCNEEMSDEDYNALLQREDRLMRRLIALLDPYGVAVHFLGDPRGATVKAIVTSDERGVEEWMLA